MEDAAFLLTVGSFLLTLELFLLAIDNFSFFYLQLELSPLKFLAFVLTAGVFLLTMGSASHKRLKGL